MKSFLIICILFLGVQPAIAQKYSKARVSLGTHALSDLIQMGVEIDHGIFEEGNFYTSEFSASDLAILKANNIVYKVIIDDVVKYFLEQNKKPSPKATPPDHSGCSPDIARLAVPSHWHLGSMGGYFTYAEMLQILDSMALLYPQLISIKKPVSDSLVTHDSLPVYVVKISDHPDSNEIGEPEVLYTAVHHAREPLGMSQLLMYMYYLLENYTTDAQIKHIVDNTEMYFIPCLNPDGYLYNALTDPNGGGMWRKNRALNGDGTYGVDLNRNYGKFWGYDNTGSSAGPSSEVFRGTSAFSEPETRMVKEFCENHNFLFALNYHTFGNDVIYPWGYLDLVTPDSAEFKSFAAYITEENKYKFGTCYETLHYTANGVSDDWFYGEQGTKNKIYTMTPECGESFWMPAAEITSTCRNLLEQNIKVASLVSHVARIVSAGDKVVTAAGGYFKFDIQRLGLQNTDTFTVRLIPLSPGLTVNSGLRKYAGMSLLESRTDSIQYTINPAQVIDRSIRYILQVSRGSFIDIDTIEKIYGDSLISVFYDDASNLTGWSNSGDKNWDLSSTEFVSPPSSIHDSPLGNYLSHANYTLISTTSIDLTNTDYAHLQFYAKWDIEIRYDYVGVYVQDASPPYFVTPLCGLYTTNLSPAIPGYPVFSGTQNTWVKEHMDLSRFAGKNIKIFFELVSSFTRRDGFYIDDITVEKGMPGLTIGIPDNRNISVSILPNPASTSINVRLNNNKSASAARYEITDIMGRSLYSVLSADNGKTIDISGLAPGIYIFTVTVDDRKLIEKFVVN